MSTLAIRKACTIVMVASARRVDKPSQAAGRAGCFGCSTTNFRRAAERRLPGFLAPTMPYSLYPRRIAPRRYCCARVSFRTVTRPSCRVASRSSTARKCEETAAFVLTSIRGSRGHIQGVVPVFEQHTRSKWRRFSRDFSAVRVVSGGTSGRVVAIGTVRCSQQTAKAPMVFICLSRRIFFSCRELFRNTRFAVCPVFR